jgi:hypothetical protein
MKPGNHPAPVQGTAGPNDPDEGKGANSCRTLGS